VKGDASDPGEDKNDRRERLEIFEILFQGLLQFCGTATSLGSAKLL